MALIFKIVEDKAVMVPRICLVPMVCKVILLLKNLRLLISAGNNLVMDDSVGAAYFYYKKVYFMATLYRCSVAQNIRCEGLVLGVKDSPVVSKSRIEESKTGSCTISF